MILLAGIAAGARDVDDIAAMGQDKGLQELLELAKWPSASTWWMSTGTPGNASGIRDRGPGQL
jgi:hypothetical protein